MPYSIPHFFRFELLVKYESWQPRWTLITLSEMGQMEILPQTVESNLSLYPFTREGHQTPSSSSSTTLYCKHRTNVHIQFVLFVVSNNVVLTGEEERPFHICSIFVYLLCLLYVAPSGSSLGQMIHSLTLRSGMENLQQEARLVLAMMRLSFATLVKLVLSRGTEINHKSAMTPSASHRDLQSKSSPQKQGVWH